ncbi:MAG: sigma-70 family RNA polymerase sigma factor [Xanthomonadales bacterium]|nr:sigma-70 family RNA polymerase sigma factor [Xanthomonadales bacterium]
MPVHADIETLLHRASEGDREAWSRLVELVYPDLKRLARSAIGGRQRHTLDTTALVHECYLRLSRAAGTPRDTGHLMALAARIMRQLLIDHARERLADKRGGGAGTVSLDGVDAAGEEAFENLVEIDRALSQLASESPRQAQVFECRYFGGLNDEQTASALGISPRTAHRDWDAGRAWLAAALGGSQEAAQPA